MIISVILQRDPYTGEKGTFIRFKATLHALIKNCLTDDRELNIISVSSSSKLSEAINTLFEKKRKGNGKIINIPGVEAFKDNDSNKFFHKFGNIYFKNPILTLRTVIPVLKKSDVLVFFEPYNQMLLAILTKIFKRKCIFDLQNNELLLAKSIFQNAQTLREKLLGFMWYTYAIIIENLLLKIADLIVMPSKIDVDSFIKHHNVTYSNRLVVIPNVIDIFPEEVNSPLLMSHEKGVLFVGDMAYPPNRQAAEIIIRDIAPTLSQKVGKIPIYLVGQSPPQRLKVPPNVHILGYVSNLREIAEKCTIAIAPIYAGAGVNYKILTYILHGLSVVATPKALEGIDDELRKHVLLAKKPKNFVDKVHYLTINSEDRVETCKMARDYVLEKYVVGPYFLKKWNNALEYVIYGQNSGNYNSFLNC